MAIQTGDLIEIAHYNDLALEVNRLFSDNTSSLVWSTSDLILDTTASAGGDPAGTQFLLSADPGTDFIVVTVNNVTLTSSDYNIVAGPNIEFVDALAASAVLKVYHRHNHRFGWGQTASVYPIVSGDTIRSDETTLQAYLESNTNNLIDKINIMEDRTTGPTELTRVTVGELIEDDEWLLMTTTINTDILTGSEYWGNDIATITSAAQTFSRTTTWDNVLIGEMRYTWDNYNSFRYFFNSGCDIRANVAMTGSAPNQGYVNWNQVTNTMGSLILDYDTASQTGSGGVSEGFGAYELTNTYQTIFTSGSPSAPVDSSGDFDEYGDYSALVMVWEARIQENTPSAGNISVDIKITMHDQNLNTTTQGTSTCNGGYKLADQITDNSAVFSMTANTPTLTVLSNFTSGDDS